MDYGKTRELFFEVAGKPKSKRTGNISTKGSFARLIKNPETAIFENLIKISFRSKHMSHAITDNAVKIEINAFFRPPNNFSKKKLKMIEGDEYPICKKPDCSNIIKVVEDGLNGVAFFDDKQIIDTSCRKFYSNRERTEIKITIYDDVEVI